MSEARAEYVIDIDQKLARLSHITSELCIFRVHERLRKVNEKAYEPEALAIGPYYHGQHNLQAMEYYKLLYLQKLLERRKETSAERYVVAMQELEGRARKFYEPPISLGSRKFVEMMLLDSCFIVELLRRHAMAVIDMDDPIFYFSHILSILRRDLLLFENQLPFFIIVQFFHLTKDEEFRDIVIDDIFRISESHDIVIEMSLNFFKNVFPIYDAFCETNYKFLQDQKHLLGLVHFSWCYPRILVPLEADDVDNEITVNFNYINSATELAKAGIKFKIAEKRNLFSIKFENGRIEIPALGVKSNTESILQNLIAYEQCLPIFCPKWFTDYAIFMDYLINSPEDVEILRRHGIINFVGDHELVSTMLNKIGHNVKPRLYSCYSDVFSNVNKNCEQQWNKAKVSLRRDYFNTPWAFISVVAAVLLLLLTATQTVFSILSVV